MFILCDAYEKVETLKGRVIDILRQLEFRMPKQEEDFEPKDINLMKEKMVSYKPM